MMYAPKVHITMFFERESASVVIKRFDGGRYSFIANVDGNGVCLHFSDAAAILFLAAIEKFNKGMQP